MKLVGWLKETCVSIDLLCLFFIFVHSNFDSNSQNNLELGADFMESLKKLKEEEEEGEGEEDEGGKDEGENSRESSSMAAAGTEEQQKTSFSTLDSALDMSERNYSDRKDKYHATKDARFQYYLAQKTG